MDAVAWVCRHEGLRLVCYDDANGQHVVPGYKLVGHPTIGYGRCLDTDGIAPDEALHLTRREVEGPRTADLRSIFNARWDGFGLPRQAALLDMHYAVGFTGFRGFHQFVTCLMNSDWAGAKAALLASRWYAEAPARVEEDAAIILTGDFP